MTQEKCKFRLIQIKLTMLEPSVVQFLLNFVFWWPPGSLEGSCAIIRVSLHDYDYIYEPANQRASDTDNSF